MAHSIAQSAVHSGRKTAAWNVEMVVEGVRIPCRFRRSKRSKRYQIVIRSEGVELVVPRLGSKGRARRLAAEREGWILEKWTRMVEQGRRRKPQSYLSGARILYRGRRLRLSVGLTSEGAAPSLRFANGFHVLLPRNLEGAQREPEVERLVTAWIDRRLEADAVDLAAQHRDQLGAGPRGFRFATQKTRWGSCGRDGTIYLNRRLAAAPKSIFDYVVVHELCHLRERNHSAAFWRLVSGLMPDYGARRRWLREHGAELG